VVDTLLRVAARYAEAHPDRPRLVVGDLSRPRGGDFGPRYGLPGHASHQSGLDVDLYYPRRDGRLEPPDTPAQVEPTTAQWLVDAFVAEGAELVFTGPSLGLRGPASIVQPLAHHDNHLHIRFAPESLPRGGP
jgi:murein endopeptidase